MDCSPPGSSVHGILQARILEWVAIPFSRASSLPRDWTQISCIAGGFFTTWATKTSSYWFKFLGRDDMVQRQWIWSACVHICVSVCTYIRSDECMCIYVYTCVCVWERERERERESWVCVAGCCWWLLPGRLVSGQKKGHLHIILVLPFLVHIISFFLCICPFIYFGGNQLLKRYQHFPTYPVSHYLSEKNER